MYAVHYTRKHTFQVAVDDDDDDAVCARVILRHCAMAFCFGWDARCQQWFMCNDNIIVSRWRRRCTPTVMTKPSTCCCLWCITVHTSGQGMRAHESCAMFWLQPPFFSDVHHCRGGCCGMRASWSATSCPSLSPSLSLSVLLPLMQCVRIMVVVLTLLRRWPTQSLITYFEVRFFSVCCYFKKPAHRSLTCSKNQLTVRSLLPKTSSQSAHYFVVASVDLFVKK